MGCSSPSCIFYLGVPGSKESVTYKQLLLFFEQIGFEFWFQNIFSGSIQPEEYFRIHLNYVGFFFEVPTLLSLSLSLSGSEGCPAAGPVRRYGPRPDPCRRVHSAGRPPHPPGGWPRPRQESAPQRGCRGSAQVGNLTHPPNNYKRHQKPKCGLDSWLVFYRVCRQEIQSVMLVYFRPLL